jgi:cytochrome P450
MEEYVATMQHNPEPAHVPSRLVYDFDYVRAPVGGYEPQQEQSRKLEAEAPDIFFTLKNGGHWIVRRAADAVEMFRRTEDFSSAPEYNTQRQWKPALLPVQADPPEHGQYRKVLGAFFAPGNMRKLEGDIRAIANAILDEIAPRGGCEFVTEVGEVFPITIFLRLVDAPLDDRKKLLRFAHKFTRSPDPQGRAEAVSGLADYIRALFDIRRANPGKDVLSQFVGSNFDRRPLTRDEEEGLGTLLFLAGLDTVRSAMSSIMVYLARNPAQYARLVDEPGLIPGAVEELLRISGTSMPERAVTHDLRYNGIEFRRGDRIFFLLPLMSFDEKLNDDPHEVNFGRELSQHLIFGSGPHRCAGSHLARIEMRILLEEWTRRFSSFGLRPGSAVPMAASTVWTPESAELVWPLAERPS